MSDYATLLRDHVTLTCRSIDRVFLQGYVPKLQSVGMVCNFLRWQRGFRIPSSAAFGKIGDAYVSAVHRFAKDNAIPVVHFGRGESKEAFARPLIDAAAAEGGDGKVVLIGIAQEKASAWRSWPAKGHEKRAHPHMEWGRQMTFVNHFYFYLWDPDWGGRVHQDQRVRTVADLDLAQRSRLGETPVRDAGHRLRGPRQRFPFV